MSARYHVKTTSGYPIGRAGAPFEVDAYVCDRDYNSAVVATFRKSANHSSREATRQYVMAQARAVAKVLNRLDA